MPHGGFTHTIRVRDLVTSCITQSLLCLALDTLFCSELHRATISTYTCAAYFKYIRWKLNFLHIMFLTRATAVSRQKRQPINAASFSVPSGADALYGKPDAALRKELSLSGQHGTLSGQHGTLRERAAREQ